MTGDALTARVLAIVAEVAGPNRAPADVGPDTALAEGGFWLESAGLLEVVERCPGVAEAVVVAIPRAVPFPGTPARLESIAGAPHRRGPLTGGGFQPILGRIAAGVGFEPRRSTEHHRGWPV